MENSVTQQTPDAAENRTAASADAYPRTRWRSRIALAVSVLVSVLSSLHATAGDAPVLRLPLDCSPGKSCWISNHVDIDPGPTAKDYACGALTYDGHNGTDFAIRDLRAMAEGVAVLAAAPGTIAAVRDGEPDISVARRGVENLDGKDCGNGVRIRHDNGWQTQYCHLLKGSIVVRPGQAVASGESIGMIGLSGKTEYPHLHFTVRRGARIIDPFRGAPDDASCGPGPRTLWSSETLATLPYAPGSVYNVGIAASIPTAQDARSGMHRDRQLSSAAPVFAVWADVFATRPGDTLEFEVTGPDGLTFISHRWRLEKRQARIFRSLARKRVAASWPPGQYQVRISLARARGDAHDATSQSFVAQVH